MKLGRLPELAHHDDRPPVSIRSHRPIADDIIAALEKKPMAIK